MKILCKKVCGGSIQVTIHMLCQTGPVILRQQVRSLPQVITDGTCFHRRVDLRKCFRHFRISIETVYFICQFVDMVKCILGYTLIKRKVWINRIV